MMLEFDFLSGKEITKLAKSQDIEIILPKLTTDEIALIIRKLSSMISCTYSEKTRSELMQLRFLLSREEYLRENIEIS
ncbi:MAG: hypothetical protein FJ357_00340 [Thaumarchaeota archaeon]|nr:hypothetical protein [Nitrososphaerota archaeon]